MVKDGAVVKNCQVNGLWGNGGVYVEGNNVRIENSKILYDAPPPQGTQNGGIGIQINPTAVNTSIENVIISKADLGILASGTGTYLHNVIVDDARDTGIQFLMPSEGGELSKVVVTNSGNHGIRFGSASSTAFLMEDVIACGTKAVGGIDIEVTDNSATEYYGEIVCDTCSSASEGWNPQSNYMKRTCNNVCVDDMLGFA